MTPAPAPISEAKLAANRENAELSTGPKSEQGKSRVRLNGLRHGLTGNTILMPDEDAARYKAFTEETFQTLRPEGPAELELARAIANGRWRLDRARAIEENIFALAAVSPDAITCPNHPEAGAALTQAQTWLESGRQINLLTLYESRIERTVRRAEAELKEFQAARRATEEHALQQAAYLAELAESKGESYDPAADGFGFSKDFLDRRIQLTRRFAEVQKLQKPQNAPLKRAA